MSRATRIVIGALGGEGGGVLGHWIADMAAREGYLSQSTSVPGVAQRTGSTIYYIEIFPRAEAEAAGRLPVMSMFPAPGDVDVVICSEIIEAGRLIQRGFVTPDRTTLVSSTHRTFGIAEKAALGNGIADKEAIIEVARANARNFIGFDMQAVAREHDSVINAALFGALAETGVLPFGREAFEETIRRSGVAVASNLAAFEACYQLAQRQRSGGVEFAEPAAAVPPEAPFVLPAGTTPRGRALLERVAGFPPDCQEIVYLGVKRLVGYQDCDYADLYLDRLAALRPLESGDGHELTRETARFLALWMAFEDLPRVAQNKISAGRFDRFREEVRAAPGQQVGMVEFLHPRVEEFCGALPAGMGRYLYDSPFWSRVIGWFAGPRNVRTNSVFGYLSFYLLAKLRRIRRRSLIYQIEQGHIEQWLAAVRDVAARDYSASAELARCGRLVKGYGSTRERGNRNLQTILNLLGESGLSGPQIAGLREAALADDEGKAITRLASELAGAQGESPRAGSPREGTAESDITSSGAAATRASA